MDFPAGYSKDLNEESISEHFPNLTSNKFEYTSLKTDDYNCIAWALDKVDEWMQIRDMGRLIYESQRYIDLFRQHGFEECDWYDSNRDFRHIAVYIDTKTGRFKHVARQLPDGSWTSKLGEWEDIMHHSPFSLIGKSYKRIYIKGLMTSEERAKVRKERAEELLLKRRLSNKKATI